MTYRQAIAIFREQLKRVSPDDFAFGLHGLRVTGYNLSVEANGEALTVAHGLWTSSAHTRYARFAFYSVCGIPSHMLNLENPYAPTREEMRAEANGRVVARTAVVRGGPVPSPGAPLLLEAPRVEPVVEPAPAPSLRGLPGWTTVTEVSGSGEQVVFYVPPEELTQIQHKKDFSKYRRKSLMTRQTKRRLKRVETNMEMLQRAGNGWEVCTHPTPSHTQTP